jgi:RHS repeat-associated protein
VLTALAPAATVSAEQAGDAAASRHVYAGPPPLRPLRERLPVVSKPDYANEARISPPRIFTGSSKLEGYLAAQNTTSGSTGKTAATDPGVTEDFAKDGPADSVYSVEGADHIINATTAPSNYMDPTTGSWANIDTTLVHDDVSATWHNAAGPVQVFFPDALSSADPTVIDFSAGTLSMVPDGLAASVAGQQQGSSVTYPGVDAGTDLVVSVLPTGYSQQLTLQQAPQTDRFTWDVQANGLTLALDASGNVSLSSGAGVIGTIPRPVVWDSSASDGGSGAAYFSYDLQDLGSGAYQLSVLYDAAWMQDPARVYPVIVDPDPTKTDNLVPPYDYWDTFVPRNSCGVPDPQYQWTYMQVGGSSCNSFALVQFNLVHRDTNNVVYDGYAAALDSGRYSGSGTVSAYRVTSSWDGTTIHQGQFPTADYSIAVQSCGEEPGSSWWEWPSTPQRTGCSGDRGSMGQLFAHIFDKQNTNYGVLLTDNSGDTTLHEWYQRGTGVANSAYPFLVLYYDTLPTWDANAALNGPANGGTITTDTPMLSVGDMPTDANADKTRVDFQVSTDPNTWDYTTIAAESGWVDCTRSNNACTTMPQWQPPSGALRDGVKYYWRAVAGDWCVWSSGPASICPNVDALGDTHDRNAFPTSAPPSFSVSTGHYGSDSRWGMWSDALGNGMSLQVNEATGNLFLSYPVESLATPAGNLAISLAYNSRQACGSCTPAWTGGDQGLSTGWMISAGLLSDSGKLPVQVQTRTAEQGGGVNLLLSDGGFTHLSQVAPDDNRYWGSGDWPGTLTKITSGSTTTWSFALNSGGTFTYDGSGYLTSAVPSTASWASPGLTYAFDSTTFNVPVLSTVTDPLGRTVTFSWLPESAGHTDIPRLQSITTWVPCATTGPNSNCDAASHLEQWSFTYQTSGDYRLRHITDASGVQVSFTYGSNNLLKMVTDGGGVATNTFYQTDATTGDQVQSVAAPSVQDPVSLGGTIGPTVFSYTPNTPQVGEVMAQAKVTDPRGGSPGVNPADFTTTTSFDVAGRPIEVDAPPEYDPTGIGRTPVTSMEWDGHGNQLCQLQPFGYVKQRSCYLDTSGALVTGPFETDSTYQSTTPYLVVGKVGPAPVNATDPRPNWTYAYDGGFQGLVRHTYDTEHLSGAVQEELVDPTLNFSGGSSFCPPGCVFNYTTTIWSISWTGTITPTGTALKAFKFRVISDEGASVSIGSDTVVGCYDPGTLHHAVQTNCGASTDPQLVLRGGTAYPISVEYFYDGGGGGSDVPTMKLQWEPPGATSFTTVPSTALAPGLNLMTSEVAPAPVGASGSTVTTAWTYSAADELHRRPTTVTTDTRSTDYVYDPTYGFTTAKTDHLQVSGQADQLLQTTFTYNTDISVGGFCLSQTLDPAENQAKAAAQAYGHTDFVCDASGETTRTTVSVPQVSIGGTVIQPQQNRVVSTVYDNVGRVLATSVPYLDTDAPPSCTPDACNNGNGWSQTVYDGAGRPTSTIDPLGNTTSYDYNSQGLLRKVTKPTGFAGQPVTYFGYDAAGNKIIQYDPRGSNGDAAHAWIWGYDGGNRQVTRTIPVGTSGTDTASSTTTTTYDLPNLKTLTSAPGGPSSIGGTTPVTVTDTVSYDVGGHKLTDQVGAGTVGQLTADSFTYDSLGNAKTQTVDGTETDLSYDEFGDLATRTCKGCDQTGQTAQDAVTAWTYDSMGRAKSMVDALGNTWSYLYDAVGRITKASLPSGTGDTLYAYDAAGDLVQVQDGAGYKRDYSFDTYHPGASPTTATYRTEQQWADGATSRWNSSSDMDGHLVETDLPINGTTRQYTYDALGELTGRVGTTPSGTVYELFGYDRNSNLTAACATTALTTPCSAGVYPQQGLAFTYDNANRLLSSTIAAGQSTARGTTYAYVGSAVASQADASGSLTSTTQFAYGTDNGLVATERWTPSGGSAESSTFVPDSFGRLHTRQDPDGLTTTYGYDNASRLASLQVDPTNTPPNSPPGPPDLAAFSRVYGPTGLVKTESRYVNGYRSVDNSTWTYTYDAAGRLWKAQPGTGSLYTYTYDGAGNRVEAKWGTTSDQTTTYNATTGLPQSTHDTVSDTTTTYTNDAAGQLTGVSTASQATTYTYDAFSRLTEASQTGTSTFDTHYTLDPLDRTTVSTLANGIPTYSGLVGRSEQIASALTSGATTWYGWDGTTPMAQSSSTGTQYFVSDPHGDLVGLADAATHALISGKTQAYDAWGNVRGTQATGAIFGYQGDPTDPNSGLVDMVTRNYDPNQGRFTTKDTVFGSTKDPTTLDQWVYGNDSPATNVDPNGMCAGGPDGFDGNCGAWTHPAGDQYGYWHPVVQGPCANAESAADCARTEIQYHMPPPSPPRLVIPRGPVIGFKVSESVNGWDVSLIGRTTIGGAAGGSTFDFSPSGLSVSTGNVTFDDPNFFRDLLTGPMGKSRATLGVNVFGQDWHLGGGRSVGITASLEHPLFAIFTGELRFKVTYNESIDVRGASLRIEASHVVSRSAPSPVFFSGLALGRVLQMMLDNPDWMTDPALG